MKNLVPSLSSIMTGFDFFSYFNCVLCFVIGLIHIQILTHYCGLASLLKALFLGWFFWKVVFFRRWGVLGFSPGTELTK